MAKRQEIEYRFLMVGKSGSGKSSTASNILGEDNAYPVSMGLAACTTTCEVRKSSKSQKGTLIRIADTPGLFDPTKSHKEIKEEIMKAAAALHPGLHAVLYVVKVGRYTPEELDTFNLLKDIFDPSIVKRVVIIFSGGDELKKKKITLETLLSGADEPFKQVLRECEKRVLVFNNVKRDEKETKELLAMVDQIWNENGEVPYSCPLQNHVNVNLERTVSMRTQEMIEKIPKLIKLIETLREAKKEDEDQGKLLQESVYKKKMKEKMLAEKTAEKEKEEQLLKEREKETQERQREEAKKSEEAEKERKRQEAEKKAEEERERKRREQEEEALRMRKELEQLKREQEVARKVKEEKKKIKEKYEKKLEEEKEKVKKEVMEKTKESIAEGREQIWTDGVMEGIAQAVGGVLKAFKAWWFR